MGKAKKNRKHHMTVFGDKQNDPELVIYTDGGCAFNPGGPGGIGVVVIDPKTGDKFEYSQGFRSTTNNRMEIAAILKALEIAKERGAKSLQIFSDSQYAINVATGEWAGTKNADLWAKYRNASAGLQIEYRWVRGHNGDPHNERCDQLATAAMGITDCKDGPKPGEGAGGAMSVAIDVPDKFKRSWYISSAQTYADTHGVTQECAELIKAFRSNRNPGFKDYLALKTGGRDRYSSMKADKMKDAIPEFSEIHEIVDPFFRASAHTLSCIRWYLRGLNLDDCIRRELVALEVAANAQKAMFRRNYGGDHNV